MNDTRNCILRVIEENVDGCGTDAVAYVMFSKNLDDETRERFENHLRAVKNRTAACDYDTDDLFQTAVEEFNKSVMAISRRIKAKIINAPYFGVVTF